jgi:glucose/arabinose dehydrogenase
MKHLKSTSVAILLISLGFSACAQQTAPEDVIAKLNVPQDFSISLFARNVPNVRSLALGDDGVVFAGTGREGKVYALQDKDRDGTAEAHYVIADGLTMPNGVAYKDGALYVAEISRILRYDSIMQNLTHPPKPSVVYDKLPTDMHHGWKYLRIGPDGKLYTAVGAPCNICNPERPVYASLVRVDTTGDNFEILGRGIRNTVGFDWQPGTDALFFSDNGRDYLGDDLPPDELNRWSRTGEHFGYPFCHGDAIADPEYGKGKQCSDYTPPVWKFKAHVAALGIRFYRGEQFPAHYRNQLFVAQHGSWNRSVPDGYRVVLVTFKVNRPAGEEVFIDGWLTKQEEVLGRPVDVLTLPDGSLLISDDHLGAIYRVQYKPKQ